MGGLTELSGVVLKNQATEKVPTGPRGSCQHSRVLSNTGAPTIKQKLHACPLPPQLARS